MTILVCGTFDTKADELGFVADTIRAQGADVLTMDVSVLGDPPAPTDVSKHDVAEATGFSIAEAASAQDENAAMQIMARGSALLAARLHAEGRFDGALVLGGTMGTDLALDLVSALPLGIPKVIVSTVAFSPLIPPERIPPDAQMVLWAGGLHGLNDLCRSTLAQAAGAVVGAARVAIPLERKPAIGMTSLGSSALTYMKRLHPALTQRGFAVPIFHATGMGGRAFEALAADGHFSAVLDLCTQEVGNHAHGSRVSAGPDRLTAAGRAGVPQIVAPGCHDLVDLPGAEPLPEKWTNHTTHAHNRLLTSVVLDADERRAVALAHCERLARATGPTVFLMPLHGTGEWDRDGAPLEDKAGLAAFVETFEANVPDNVEYRALDAHINDETFSDAVLDVLDEWLTHGTVPSPV